MALLSTQDALCSVGERDKQTNHYLDTWQLHGYVQKTNEPRRRYDSAWDGRAKDSFINKSMFKLLQNNDCLYLSFSLLCTVEGYLLGALFILVLENVGYFFILVPKCNFYNSFPLHLPPKCELAIVQVCCFCFSIGTEINERKTFYTLWKKSHSFIFKTFSNTLTLYGKNTT